MMFASRMMCGFATFYGKHRIIATNGSNIIFAKQMHHIAVGDASFMFGLWHIINGSIIQVLFAFGIGLVFGFAKYRIKNCGYVGVAFGHGLYDFLNTLVRMFIV